MLLGQVKGHVVSTAKVESLNGKKLMLVEVVSVREYGLVTTGRAMVCIDAVQAGAHGVSTADVVLRWLRQRGIVAIPKSPQPRILLHLSNHWRVTFWVWW